MRIILCVRVFLVALVGVCSLAEIAKAKRIDAVRGRKYEITKKHGPWMVMVASFHKPPPGRRGKGMTPKKAADELVYELRKKGIPAYAFSRKGVYEELATRDRAGRRRRSFAAYRGGVTVLAGNYAGPQDRLAKATLTYIKKFRPRFLNDVQATNGKLHRTRSGGLFRSTPGRPGPLSGAHLTTNPLLSPAQIRNRRKDPLLLKLNGGSKMSLLRNTGKYTLIVKTFYGKSITHRDTRSSGKKFKKFNIGNSLDKAGREAWQLAVAIRKFWKIEAWVYHDRYTSIVTVGSFRSDKDPRIKNLADRFRAKKRFAQSFGADERKYPQSGRQILVAEAMTIPPNPKPGQSVNIKWLFDPKPRLMLVPKFGR